MTVAEALDALTAAYEAKDAALGRAVQDVERQFAAIIALRQREYQDAARRQREERA